MARRVGDRYVCEKCGPCSSMRKPVPVAKVPLIPIRRSAAAEERGLERTGQEVK